MCIFYKLIIIFIYTIIKIKSERWYSAKIDNSADVDNPLNDLQQSEHRFTPLLSMQSKFLNNNSDFIVDKMSNTNRIVSFNESDVIVGHNIDNTINSFNVQRSRPKRKYFRKRCPVFGARKTFTHSKHKPKFLEVFHVVEFDHVPCTSINGLEGTCFPEYDCSSSGGKAMGSCADGYGTCCITLLQCNERSSSSSGWFTNPDFPLPSTEAFSCSLTLDKSSEDVKQIRLDFNTFELLPPTDGVCLYDQFVVSGQNINNIIPILCGINTGQHVYIQVDDVDGPINLTFQTDSPESRLFSIRVQQLASTDDLAAPSGCLQYYKQPKGYIESFNYRNTSDIVIPKITSYFNNLNYAICIERAAATCSITYTNAGNMQIPNYDIDGLPVIPPNQAGVEILNCPSDWLLIAATRLCGERLNDGYIFQDFSLNAPVTDNSAGPIVVWFRSDESYVGKGFRLLYQQNACNT